MEYYSNTIKVIDYKKKKIFKELTDPKNLKIVDGERAVRLQVRKIFIQNKKFYKFDNY